MVAIACTQILGLPYFKVLIMLIFALITKALLYNQFTLVAKTENRMYEWFLDSDMYEKRILIMMPVDM